MEILQKIWNWLNGNKTFIGLFIMLVLEQGWLDPASFVYQILFWLGGLLAGGGMLHKLNKATTEKGPNK